MKYILLLLASASSALAQLSVGELRIQQVATTTPSTVFAMRSFGVATSDPFLLGFAGGGTSGLPTQVHLGPSITYTAITGTTGTLDVDQSTLTSLQPMISSGTTDQYYRGDKTWVNWVNADWNAVSGGAQVLNKPTLGTAAAQNSSAFATAAQGATADSALQPSGNGSSLTGLTQSQISGLTTALGNKFNNPAGTTGQYIRGDGSLATFPSIPSGTVTSVGLSSSDFSVSGSPVTSSGSITANLNASGVSAGTYSGVTVTTKGIVTAGTTRSFANPSRTLNSAFQISSTRDAIVSYTVDISASLTLSGGATGTVTLEYADDSGFTTNVVTVQSSVNGNTGALTIGLSLTQTASASLCGVIPAGKYVRLRTANTAGTPSFNYRGSQEVLA